MNEKVLQAVIKLKDEISKPLKSVNSALKSTRSATEGVTDSLDNNTKEMLSAKDAMKQYTKQQKEAAQKIFALGISVRQAELLCKNLAKGPVGSQQTITLAVDYVAECEKALSKQLGRGVKIVNGKRKGRFELEFYGQEDLQNLLDALMKLK